MSDDVDNFESAVGAFNFIKILNSAAQARPYQLSLELRAGTLTSPDPVFLVKSFIQQLERFDTVAVRFVGTLDQGRCLVAQSRASVLAHNRKLRVDVMEECPVDGILSHRSIHALQDSTLQDRGRILHEMAAPWVPDPDMRASSIEWNDLGA